MAYGGAPTERSSGTSGRGLEHSLHYALGHYQETLYLHILQYKSKYNMNIFTVLVQSDYCTDTSRLHGSSQDKRTCSDQCQSSARCLSVTTTQVFRLSGGFSSCITPRLPGRESAKFRESTKLQFQRTLDIHCTEESRVLSLYYCII